MTLGKCFPSLCLSTLICNMCNVGINESGLLLGLLETQYYHMDRSPSSQGLYRKDGYCNCCPERSWRHPLGFLSLRPHSLTLHRLSPYSSPLKLDRSSNLPSFRPCSLSAPAPREAPWIDNLLSSHITEGFKSDSEETWSVVSAGGPIYPLMAIGSGDGPTCRRSSSTMVKFTCPKAPSIWPCSGAQWSWSSQLEQASKTTEYPE